MSGRGYIGAGVYLALAVMSCVLLLITTGAATTIAPGMVGVPGTGQAPNNPTDIHAKPAPKIVYSPSNLQCYRWPDGTMTQTFDPMSPACQSTWDYKAGNGGSTAPGVDGSVIKVGVAKISPTMTQLANFFNANYEFYGRSIKLVETGPFMTPAQQRASVAQAASQKVFMQADVGADTYGPPSDPDAYAEDLARKGIISVQAGPVSQQSVLTAASPYAWTVPPPQDVVGRRTAEWVCAALANKPARLSGDEADKTKTRKFAIIRPATGSVFTRTPDVAGAAEVLATCGDKPKVRATTVFLDSATVETDDKLMLGELKKEGVTTVVVLGAASSIGFGLSRFADELGYHPEWVIAGGQWLDMEQFRADKTSNEANIFGTMSDAPYQAVEKMPWVRAALDAGITKDTMLNEAGIMEAYKAFSLVAAGIQAAGPTLTADSFAYGLEAAQFPNPGAGAAPTYQQRVGFALGDHYFLRDLGLGWWDQSMVYPGKVMGFDATPGGVCFFHHGERWDADKPWPTSDAGIADPDTC